MLATAVRDPLLTSPIRSSSRPRKPSDRLSKDAPSARKILIRCARSLGFPGSLPASAVGTATTNHQARRRCGSVGTPSPLWQPAMLLLLLDKILESRSSQAGEGREGALAYRLRSRQG